MTKRGSTVILEHLDYFKNLIEGQEVETWHKWWRLHQAELELTLPRSLFLRLKFGKVIAAAELLKESDIAFDWTPKGRRQAAYANLHPTAVDPEGYPLEAFRAQAYGGALGLLIKGDLENGRTKLARYLNKLKRTPDVISRAEELSDIEFDAENLFQEGHAVAAITILQAIREWQTDSDLEIPIIKSAERKLYQIMKDSPQKSVG